MPHMPDSFAALPRTIQELLEKRLAHVQALAGIDATLARINAALAGASVAAKTAGTKPAAKATAPKKTRKRAKGNGQTTNEFVLAFVKENKNPTSQEINAAWK